MKGPPYYNFKREMLYSGTALNLYPNNELEKKFTVFASFMMVIPLTSNTSFKITYKL